MKNIFSVLNASITSATSAFFWRVRAQPAGFQRHRQRSMASFLVDLHGERLVGANCVGFVVYFRRKMSGMEALGAAAFALEDGISLEEDESMSMKFPLEDDPADDIDAKLASQTSHLSEDTTPIPIIVWSKPKAPSVVGPVDAPGTKDTNKVAAWKKAFKNADEARQANAEAVELLYMEFCNVCAHGKKLEEALKASEKKSKKSKNLQRQVDKLKAENDADKRVRDAEKRAFKQEIAGLKKEVKNLTNQKKKSDLDSNKEVADLRKELSSSEKKVAAATKECATIQRAHDALVNNQKILEFQLQQYKAENNSLSTKVAKLESAELRTRQAEARMFQKEDAAARRSQQKKETHQVQLARAIHRGGYRRSSSEILRMGDFDFDTESDDNHYCRKVHKKNKKRHRRRRYREYSSPSSDSSESTPKKPKAKKKKKQKNIEQYQDSVDNSVVDSPSIAVAFSCNRPRRVSQDAAAIPETRHSAPAAFVNVPSVAVASFQQENDDVYHGQSVVESGSELANENEDFLHRGFPMGQPESPQS